MNIILARVTVFIDVEIRSECVRRRTLKRDRERERKRERKSPNRPLICTRQSIKISHGFMYIRLRFS